MVFGAVRRLSLAVFGSLFIIFFSFTTIHANANDFRVTNFEADYYLSRDDPQGTLEVHETIDVIFNNRNHGILRAIPKAYKKSSLNLDILSVSYSGADSGSDYTSSVSNGNLVLKIGNPSRTITGQQQYKIHYKMDNVISFYDDYDELYWDINGVDWQQSFSQVVTRVHLPPGLTSSDRLRCFAGKQGSTSEDCIIREDSGVIVAQSIRPLIGGETLTIVVGVDKGYFASATIGEKLLDNMGLILTTILMPALVGGYAILHWLRNGRDPAGRGTIIPEYDPPKSMRPAEVGALAGFKVNQRDITATIIDLAVRGYIKIIEEKKTRRFRKDELKYYFELTKKDFSELKDYEATLLKGIFKEKDNLGEIVPLEELVKSFYKEVSSAKSQIIKRLVSEQYLKKHPSTAGLRLWVLLGFVVLAMYALVALLGPLALVGTGIAAIIVFVCALSMPARTAKGVEANEQSKGLRLYIKTAEADRLKMMQSPDARYTRTIEPKKTVHLYEKLLPFAISFGVEKQWAEEFKSIYIEEPAWFSGTDRANFNSIYLANTLNGSLGTAMTSAFSNPSSSGGSGFSSGGGFSGGGGGGGGGGGW